MIDICSYRETHPPYNPSTLEPGGLRTNLSQKERRDRSNDKKKKPVSSLFFFAVLTE